MYDNKSEFEMLDDLLSLEQTKEELVQLNLEVLKLKEKVADLNEQPE